jgi:superfamily II DNA or RNA helicase
MAGTKRWRSTDIWSRPIEIDGNIARQLLVPDSVFDSIDGSDGALLVSNQYGRWPASPVDRPLAPQSLWLRLPIGAKAGGAVSASSGWNRPTDFGPDSTNDVLASYRAAISFIEGTEQSPGLRPPQLGAIHAVLGYWTTKRPAPATVVMPTGTGKTDTMVGLLVAARPERLLVVVPSDALREQIAAAFDRLGVLQRLRIVASSAKRPVVGRLLHGFKSAENAGRFADTCNVVVATPAALHASPSYMVREFLSSFSHLFVDEAHHVAAGTWSRIRDEFGDRPVVQFTATPFREDGKHLQGTIIYSFPLREAQAQRLFSEIDFTSIVDFEDPDRALATAALRRLRNDIDAGYDHVLMARVRSVARANQIFELYRGLANDLGVVVTYSALATSKKKAAVDALRNGTARVVVCVDMLGEGFDLPALKVAAVHEPHKSLGVTLQFIGRFARTSTSGVYGTAALFVARTELESRSAASAPVRRGLRLERDSEGCV